MNKTDVLFQKALSVKFSFFDWKLIYEWSEK